MSLDRFRLGFQEAREAKQLASRFLEIVGDRATFQPQCADARLVRRRNLQLRFYANHILVIGGTDQRRQRLLKRRSEEQSQDLGGLGDWNGPTIALPLDPELVFID